MNLCIVRPLGAALVLFSLVIPSITAAQQQPGSPRTPDSAPPPNAPEANPGRPTISTPATLTPVGYFQFETGFLAAWHSPEFLSQSSFIEVVKFSPWRRIELLAGAQPFAHTTGSDQVNAAGDVVLGFQGLVHRGEGVRPCLAVSYFRRVYNGDAPNLDVGSPSNSLLLMASAEVKGFHYDTNYLFNEVVDADAARRAQFGQTLSVSHSIRGKLGATGEIWHFTQPILRGHAVGTLWALSYNLRPNLVLDAGFDRGLTSTSTRWELLAGFTYLLPHKPRLW